MGAQGPVFCAQDTVAGQIVAIKALKLDVSPELAPSIAEALRTLVGQAPAVEGLVPLRRVGSPRAEVALARLFAAIDPALLGAAYAALHGGPSVSEFARSLPAEASGPPSGIWTA